jgi:hypothetical protein
MLARVDLLFVLPLLFLLTQALAVPRTICPQSHRGYIDAVRGGSPLVLCRRVVRAGRGGHARVFGGLALATLFVCILAMQQHFGGLQETREYAVHSRGCSTAPGISWRA